MRGVGLLQMLLCSVSMVLLSCSPRDSHVHNVKQRLMDGEVLLYTKPGDRLPTCRESDNDWSDLRIHENDYNNFVLGNFIGLMTNGYKNCQRVGNRVYVSSDRIKTNGSLGWAEITAVGLVRLDVINKTINTNNGDYNKKKAIVTNNKNIVNFDETVERLAKSSRPEHQGIIHITLFKYIPNSSSLEAKIKSKYAEESSLENKIAQGEIIQLDKEGEKLPSCSPSDEVWKEFRIHEKEYPFLVNGTLETVIVKGLKNCHVVGQTVQVVSKGIDSVGFVKIKRLKLLSLEQLKKHSDFVLGSAAKERLESNISRLEKELSDKPYKVLSLVDVEYLGENNEK